MRVEALVVQPFGEGDEGGGGDADLFGRATGERRPKGRCHGIHPTSEDGRAGSVDLAQHGVQGIAAGDFARDLDVDPTVRIVNSLLIGRSTANDRETEALVAFVVRSLGGTPA